MNDKKITVAVVGATGAVGRTMIQVLSERAFPLRELRLLASGRSAGREVVVDGRTMQVGEAVPDAFEGVDIALFSAGAGVSEALAPEAVARGATVIDNSAAWRMHEGVPLVVSQVNPDDAATHEGIIANPNCSTMQLAPVLMALRDAVGIERVVVDTYQSVSGTGADAMEELEEQVRAHVAGGSSEPHVYPHRDRVQRPARDRRLPPQRLHQGGVEARRREPQDPPPAGAPGQLHGRPRAGLREPFRGRPRRAEGDRSRRRRARDLFAAVPGVVVQDDPASHVYPLATEAAGSDDVFVGRVRQDPSIPDGRGLAFWVRLGQPAQGRRDERRGDRRADRRPRLGAPGLPASRGGMTEAERRTALEAIATEVRACTACRLHVGRTQAVPGEGHPIDRGPVRRRGTGLQRGPPGPAVRRAAGSFLTELLGSVGWKRDEVFITNVVKCRPPDNRDPEPDEIAACAPFLRRQVEALDPALVVTLGRHSMGGSCRAPGSARSTARRRRPTRSRRPRRRRLRDVPPGGGPAPGLAPAHAPRRHGPRPGRPRDRPRAPSGALDPEPGPLPAEAAPESSAPPTAGTTITPTTGTGPPTCARPRPVRGAGHHLLITPVTDNRTNA